MGEKDGGSQYFPAERGLEWRALLLTRSLPEIHSLTFSPIIYDLHIHKAEQTSVDSGSKTIPANLVTLCKSKQWARCQNSLKKKDWRTRGWGMGLWFTVGQKGLLRMGRSLEIPDAETDVGR